MNRLLSFNPEPIEDHFKLENVSQAYGTTKGGSEKESEWEYVGARSRNVRFRKPSISSLREAAIRADRRAIQGPPNDVPFTTPVLITPPAEQTIQRTVYGWGRYKQRVGELPLDQQGVLKGVGNAIFASYRPGGQPVRNVKVYGHADWDTPRNPQREQQMSDDRASAITDWLKNYVGNIIAAQISWDTRGFGATKLKASPTTEARRRQNRRVEIMLISDSGRQPRRKRGYLLVGHNRLVGNLTGVLHPPVTQSKNRMLAFRPISGPIIAQVRIPIANLREDVMNAMNRLHVLWSMSNPDYDAEYPVVDKLPPGSTVDVRLIPRTLNAIIRNQEPTIHQQVANYLLNQPLGQPVGRNLTNLRSDVLLVQTSLRALELLSDADFTSERAAVMSLATVSNADAVMPKTLAAITRLKEAIAGFRLGWDPLQADESEAGGDRYGGRTFNFTITTRCFVPGVGEQNLPHRVSFFSPRHITSDVNNVHIYFSPRGAADNRGDNDILVQGLRGAADPTNSIVIGVSGIVNGWRTIDDATIQACLVKAGRSPTITSVRLSGHSRGVSGLSQTLKRQLIKAPINRIHILDAPELFQRGGKNVIVYRVNVRKQVPGAIHRDLDPGCMRAIGYTRLIQNAMVTRPLLSIPPDIRAQLLPIPNRGCFRTTPTPSHSTCPTNLNDFCQRHHQQIASILRHERNDGNRKVPEGLHTFVERFDLLRAGHRVSPGIYSHHIFVAEVAHELMMP
jgi:hypothetical protein